MFTVMCEFDWPEGCPMGVSMRSVGISMFMCTSGRSKVNPLSPVGVPEKMVGDVAPLGRGGVPWIWLAYGAGSPRALLGRRRVCTHN